MPSSRPTSAVLSDEIYEQLTYGDARPTCFATLRPGLADRTITISGVSKTYAMTGWRMGWAVAPGAGGQVHGGPPEPGDEQPLLDQPVGGPRGDHRPPGFRGVDEGRRSRNDAITCSTGSPTYPAWAVSAPGGAFYAFMNVSAHFGRTLARQADHGLDRLLHGGPE